MSVYQRVNMLMTWGWFMHVVYHMDVGQNGRPMWDHRCECLVFTIHNFGVPNFDPYPHGYGSIPIDTFIVG